MSVVFLGGILGKKVLNSWWICGEVLVCLGGLAGYKLKILELNWNCGEFLVVFEFTAILNSRMIHAFCQLCLRKL